jgi:hypothetical protein
MNIQRTCRDLLDGAHNRRADRDIRHEVAIHDVDVNQIGTAALDGRNVATESRKVGGQNRGGDLDLP